MLELKWIAEHAAPPAVPTGRAKAGRRCSSAHRLRSWIARRSRPSRSPAFAARQSTKCDGQLAFAPPAGLTLADSRKRWTRDDLARRLSTLVLVAASADGRQLLWIRPAQIACGAAAAWTLRRECFPSGRPTADRSGFFAQGS